MPTWKSGWGVVLATWLCLFVGASPVVVFTFGNFMAPFTAEFGWNRGAMSTAFAAGAFAAAFAAPLSGWLIDRYGLRRVTLPAIVASAAIVAAQALNNGSLALLVVLQFLVGAITVVLTALPYVKAITTWFDHNRGLALGLSTLGGAVGMAVIPQVAQYVIAHHGWRTAYLVLGGLVLVFAFLPAFLLLFEAPKTSTKTASAAQAIGLTAAEARRTWRLWAICAVFLLGAAGTAGVIGQLVPMLVDRGIPVAVATGALGVFAISSAVSRLVSGFLLDRVFAPLLGAACFLAAAIGLALLLSTQVPALLTLGIVFCGIAIGLEYDLLPYLVSRYVGTLAFGELVGYAFFSFSFGTGTIGPLLMGNSHSMMGSYRPALMLLCGGLVIASALLLVLGPYAYAPKRKTVTADDTSAQV
jgi:MFS family permease